jgi:hypothetical protein
MYKALGIVGNRNLLVAGIYNCTGPLASKLSPFLLNHRRVWLTSILRSHLHHLPDRSRWTAQASPMGNNWNYNRLDLWSSRQQSNRHSRSPKRTFHRRCLFSLLRDRYILSWVYPTYFPLSNSTQYGFNLIPQQSPGDQYPGSTWQKSCPCKSELAETLSQRVSEIGS